MEAACAGLPVLALGVAGAWALGRRGLRREGLHGLLAAVLCGVMAGFAALEPPPGTARVPDLGRWLRAEAGDRPVAILNWGDTDLGTFCFTLERIVVPLRGAAEAERFLSSAGPSFCIVRGGGWKRLLEPGEGRPACTVFARSAVGGRDFTILANAPAGAWRPRPTTPPPGDPPAGM